MKEHCFQINRISAGWIDGMLCDAHTKIVFSNSYLRNFPEDLMLAILTVFGAYPADEHKETFRAEMDALLHRFGFLGYRMEWDSEFPLSLFLKIKDIAAGKNTLSLSVVIPSEQNFGAEAAGSDFAAECELIQTISQ